jgi:hypothetical protein
MTLTLPKEGTQERKIYDTLLATGPTFTYSDYFERVLWLSQFHRALHNLKHRFEIEIEKSSEPNVHGFSGYRLKQGPTRLQRMKRKLPRGGMTVRPTNGAEYPCPHPAREYGMCSQHVKVTAKKIAKLGLNLRKVRSDKGAARREI